MDPMGIGFTTFRPHRWTGSPIDIRPGRFLGLLIRHAERPRVETIRKGPLNLRARPCLSLIDLLANPFYPFQYHMKKKCNDVNYIYIL